MKANPSSKNPEAAFNLTELCVVLACVAVLALMVLPALAASKMQNASTVCLYNLRHLMTGWEMYRTENNDYLMPNNPSTASSLSWISSLSVQHWTAVNANTNAMLYQTNLMGGYLTAQFGVSAYRCPGDVVPSANGQRIRTYSMQGQLSAAVSAAYNGNAKIYFKGSDITGNPGPSGLIVFLEESGCDLGPSAGMDGYLQVNNAYGSTPGTYSGSATFPDVPGAYHNGGCGISFADGRSEIHNWATSVLKIPVTYGLAMQNILAGGLPPSPKVNADWLWFTSHCAAHK